MGWATAYIEKLKKGETVQFRPSGHSMTGRVNNKQLVTVEPFKCRTAGCSNAPTCRLEWPSSDGWQPAGQACDHCAQRRPVTERVVELVKAGDVVLCKVNGSEYLHLVKAVQGERVLIGNNKGRINGWTTSIYGRCIKVED